MSLSDLDVKKIYPGDGSTTSFAITADFDDNSEIRVVLRDESTTPAAETVQTLGTDYSISSGNVVMTTAPASTEKLLIVRVNPLTQAVDLVGSGELGVETLESSLDKLTKIVQELDERVDRAPKLPETYPNEGSPSISDLALGEPSASALVRWNSSGDALEAVNAADADLVTVPVTTTGDIFTYGASDVARLAVGTNGSFLQADSGETTGLKYTALALPASSWNVESGGPVEDFENNLKVYLFEDALTQKIAAVFRVPSFYIAGSQINLRMLGYSATGSLTNKLTATTTLLEPGSSAATSTTNQHTSTNSAVTNTVANQIESHVMDLTDGSGEINSVAVAAGDLLLIEVERDTATDTDTATMRVIADASEVAL